MADGGSPPWGVAPDRQKKVPWTTLTSLSASRQVCTVQAVFSVYTQECYPFPFLFLHKRFLSLVFSSFYTEDCYPLSFHLFTQKDCYPLSCHLFTQRIFILVPLSFLHKGFLSFVFSSICTNDFFPFAFIFYTQDFSPCSFYLFLHKGFLSMVLSSFLRK